MEDKLQSIIELYRYIFEYLKTYEYFQFIKTSKKISHLKQTTIQYRLYACNTKPLDYWKLWKMIKTVKYPNKQIDLCLMNVPLGSIGFISPHLRQLYVDTGTTVFTNDFDFSIFNNIPDVCLNGFNKVTRISSGLQNIQNLRLSLRDLLTVYDFNETGKLLKLTFVTCSHLTSFPSQQGNTEFPSILARCHWDIIGFGLLGKNRLDTTQLFTNHLQQLQLTIKQPQLTVAEINSLIHVTELRLAYVCDTDSEAVTHQPGFSSFYGNNLELAFFDLSLWAQECEFPSLKTMYIENCKTPATLPYFPVLRELRLVHMTDLHNIPIIPNLSIVKITNCPVLTCFSVLPGRIPRSFGIKDCPNLSLVLPIDKYRNLKLKNCPYVSFPCLNHVKPYWCHSSWKLVNYAISSQIQQLNYLKYLSLQSIHGTDFLKLEISNIDVLKITNCLDFHTSKNISNIKELLVLEHCPNLTSLENLQNTPNVYLLSLPMINNITGLGNHESLHIHRVPFLTRLVRWYAKSKKEGKEQFHPFHYIFGTIQSCTVLKKSRSEDDDCYQAFVEYDAPALDREVLW